ncbi:hypothetical protein pipiens_018716 [Culex pipiens pipiens]|uniref:Endonuclease/exonuclease/phosphatase domain-containing protein n=1 Tax=Culex pipiens pipiens TaxID=38569 RepID=A0ABD1DYQ9_CULPP
MDLSVGDVFKLLNDNGLPRSEAFLLKHTRTSVQSLTKSKEVFDKAVSVLKTGDLNARHRQWNCFRANKAGNILASRASSSDFFIHAPLTHSYHPKGGRRPSTLDLVLSNNFVDMSSLTVVNDLSSDHLPVRFDVFQRVLNEKIDLTSPLVTNLESPEAIDRCIAMFTSFIIEAESTAVPTAPVRSYKEAEFAKSTRRLVQLRNTRRRQWFRTRDPLLADIVEALNVRIRNECTIARNQHFSSSIRHLENGAKDLWRISKALRNSVKYTPPLKNGDSLVAAPSEKANLLADSFANAHRNTLPSEPSVIAQVEESVAHITATDSTTAAAPVVRPKELQRIIQSLKPKKAPGLDKVGNIVLKRLPRKGIVVLTKIVIACLALSYFPSSWKHAIVR